MPAHRGQTILLTRGLQREEAHPLFGWRYNKEGPPTSAQNAFNSLKRNDRYMK